MRQKSNARLRLVHSAQVKRETASPRPFATYYYGQRAREDEWAAIGHAKTANGAVRAAVWRILERRAHRAVINDEDGLRIIRVERRGRSIVIVGV